MKNLLFMLLAMQLNACQNKETQIQPTQSKEMQKNQDIKTTFPWEEGLNAPVGYPVHVYRGGLELANGFVGLSGLGITTGLSGWGSDSNGMSSGIKSLPKKINCVWLSYAEDCMYEINSEVDYDKIVQLFNQGYVSTVRKKGKIMSTYNTIMVGFAPGGVVVLWVSGAGRKTEIGRYQGKKIVVSPEEIASLDSHEKLLFDPIMRKHVMENPKIVPKELQAANKNKPIPFGLWDTYREKYSWRTAFIFPEGCKMYDDLRLEMINGEKETLLYEEFYENKFQERAIPTGLSFSWWDKSGQGYAGIIDFDEKEILNAFNTVFKINSGSNAELLFTINKMSTFFTVKLKAENLEIILLNSTTKVFESSGVTSKYVKE